MKEKVPVISEKQSVYEFWNAASCGETAFLAGLDKEAYQAQLKERYRIEPYILPFADFNAGRDKSVLEIGVGLGADHQMWAQSGATLFGIDLTDRSIDHVRRRLALLGLHSNLEVADAEKLPFPDALYDIVYSWGVLHHSPDTPQAIREVHRVLKPGGIAKVMIYHKFSIVGLMLWLRYGLLRGRPFTTMKTIFGTYLESSGTKAYTISEAKALFGQFGSVMIQVQLSSGDLLEPHVGQRHQGLFLRLAKVVFPRKIVRKFFPGFGLFLLITATK